MFESKDNRSQSSAEVTATISAILKLHAGQPYEALKKLIEATAAAEQEGRSHDALAFNAALLQQAEAYSARSFSIHGLLTRGRLLINTNQISEALTPLSQALQLSAKESALPAEQRAHICYVGSHLISGIFLRQGRLPQADAILEQCAVHARNRFGPGSPQQIQILFERCQLAVGMKADDRTILHRIAECRSGIVGQNSLTNEQKGHISHELGMILYHHCLWEEASSMLDMALKLTTNQLAKTEMLLALGNIASYKSDPVLLTQYVDQAEKIWMDVAPVPRIERYIANLRAIAALSEGCSKTYQHEITLAQEVGEGEELSIEDRITIHFARATSLRMKNLNDRAHDEIKEAHRLLNRGVVNPLLRFSTLLQRGYCEHHNKQFISSNSHVDEALRIAQEELQQNTVLTARALSLRAHNGHSIFTCAKCASPASLTALRNALKDGERALEILSNNDIDPYGRKNILRLLSSITGNLKMPLRQADFDNELAVLEWEFPNR